MGRGDRGGGAGGRAQAELHAGARQSRIRARAKSRPAAAMTQIALVIPAYRPPPLRPGLIESISSIDADHVIESIIVVDDGSEAAYAQTFEAAARLPRVTIVGREANGGQGAALKTGIAHALATIP